MKKIKQQKQQQNRKYSSHLTSKTKLRDVGDASHGEYSEWEVLNKGSYDELENSCYLKR